MSNMRSIIEAASPNGRSRYSWNDRLWHWERAPSNSEEDRIQRAANAAISVVQSNAFLTAEAVEILPQGSYHNNTNVRLEADMDLRVQLPTIYVRYGEGVDQNHAYVSEGYVPTGRSFLDVANAVRAQLSADCVRRFGAANVKTGKKAVTVSGLSTQADVDLVPAFKLHWIEKGYSGFVITEGVAILSTENAWTLNYPTQHHENGKAKRARTAHRFKQVVRMLKRLNYELHELGLIGRRLPSFLVECLVYCVEDSHFLYDDDRYDRLRRVLYRARELLADAGWSAQAAEVNGIKFLFHPSQAWTHAEAKVFVAAAIVRLEA